MPRPLAGQLALLLGLAALTLGACGEEDAQLLPGETAQEITANLNAVQRLVDEGDCAGAEAATEQVSEQVEALGGVDPKLKQALEDGAARLNEVIAECEETPTEAIAPAIVPEEGEEDEERPSDDGKGKDEGGEERDGGPEPASPSLPPQAKGEGKGLDEGNGPPEDDSDDDGGGESEGDEGEEEQSGGVSPGAPAGEAE